MHTFLNKSILVVDDEPRMLNALNKVLTSEGAVVTCAYEAKDAIDILTSPQTQVDLLITDLRMPAVSGMTVLSAVNTIFPRPPVIVLTAFASPYVKAECLRQGAAAFLEKPFDSEKLVTAINKVFLSQDIQPGSNPPSS